MQTMSVITTINADSLVLAGVSAFNGKKVRITIEEEPLENNAKHQAFFDLAGKIDIDYQTVEDLRSESML